MAIDTLRKRTAALRFGMPWQSGTRPPGSSFNSFERAALLGLYHPTGAGDHGSAVCGFTFGDPETVFVFHSSETVLTFEDC